MKFDEVKEIINMINDSELSYFEVNIDNKYIKMDKSMSRSYGSLNQSYSNISEIIEEKSLDTNLNNKILVKDFIWQFCWNSIFKDNYS